MALLKYLEPQSEHLPNPKGSLVASIRPAAVRAANECVQSCAARAQHEGGEKKRSPYTKLTIEKRAEIGTYATENGIVSAEKHYSKELQKPLNESTVCGLKKAYLQELSRKRKAEEDVQVLTLPMKKQGAPLKLGMTVDRQVQAYLRALREKGAWRCE